RRRRRRRLLLLRVEGVAEPDVERPRRGRRELLDERRSAGRADVEGDLTTQAMEGLVEGGGAHSEREAGRDRAETRAALTLLVRHREVVEAEAEIAARDIRLRRAGRLDVALVALPVDGDVDAPLHERLDLRERELRADVRLEEVDAIDAET